MISPARSRVRKSFQKPSSQHIFESISSTMTRHDCNQNEELVYYCDVTMTEKAFYRIQPGLTSGGFYRNRKKARKALETRSKIHKENGNVYERSVSVPALGGQLGSSPLTSPETKSHHNKLRVVLPPANANLRPGGRHASEGTERSLSTFAQGHHSRSASPLAASMSMTMSAPSWSLSSSPSLMDYDTHPGTPGTPKDFLTSPPVDSAASFEARGSSAESGGLYVLKKDAERRSKLIDILTEDASKLCEIWTEDQELNQANRLTELQMNMLAKAMREFIHSQDSTQLDCYLKELVNTVVHCGAMTMEELQRSIYSLNEASVKILKERQMPPHWMFTFDDFLKTTIKHSIEFLTPQLRSDDSVDDESTSPTLHTSVSMMNGDYSDGAPVNKLRKDIMRLQEQYTKSQEDNVKLWRELNTMDKNYQQLLRGILRERKTHVQCLADAIAMPPPTPLAIATSMCGMDSPPSISDSQPDSPEISIAVPQIPVQAARDEKLVKWLESLSCDRVAISKFVTEEYTLSDVMELVSRDDLRRMNLRGGVECRIWREIVKARQTGNHTSVYNNNMDSD